MKWVLLFTIITLTYTFNPVHSQRISVNADDYQQVYEGGGISYGLYKSHIWSMSQANQDLFFEMLFKDIKMKYVQYYAKTRPESDSGEYDKVRDFMNGALAHDSDLDLIFVLGDFPADMKVDGNEDNDLNVSDPEIYDKAAQWMLDMMNAMHERGTPIDIYSMANEPDYQSSWELGYESNSQGLALLTQNAVPKLKELLTVEAKNPYDLDCPKILAPATIGPGGCRNFMNDWKANYPDAWAQLDFVGTHQYILGDDYSRFEEIQAGLEGLRFLQTEQHTNKGDDLGSLPLTSPHRGILSLASFFDASLNHGVESWFYFVTNYPDTYHNGGLIRVPWGGDPTPYKTYYAFKQLNSIQTDESSVLTYTLTNVDNLEVITLRKLSENKIVLHIANVNPDPVRVLLDAQGSSQTYGISGVKTWVTDDILNIDLRDEFTYSQSLKEVAVNLDPYSLTSVELTIDPSGYTAELQDQSITFTSIDDKILGDVIEISATASSGLPVNLEVLDGSATISGNTITTNGLGTVSIRASQTGNDSYLPATDIIRSFIVYPTPTMENIALNKTTTVSSVYSSYLGSNAVDGDKTSNSSRWLSSPINEENFPQWLEVDLGGEYLINGFGFWTGYNGPGTPIVDFEFQIWSGTDWISIYTEDGNYQPSYLKTINTNKTSKVRLLIDDADDTRAKVFEFEVYGEEYTSTNLALNRPVNVSSIYTSSTPYTGDKAVDGNISSNSSRWLSEKDAGMPQWIEIELDGQCSVKGMAFYVGYSSYKDPIIDFDFEAWDGSQWVNIFSETNNDNPAYSNFFDAVQTNKVRLYMNQSTDDEAKMFEIEVYGDKVTTAINDYSSVEFKVFPNPVFDDYLTIATDENIENVKIYSVSGQLVQCNVNNNIVDVSNLKPGIYFISVNYQTIKFIRK